MMLIFKTENPPSLDINYHKVVTWIQYTIILFLKQACRLQTENECGAAILLLMNIYCLLTKRKCLLWTQT